MKKILFWLLLNLIVLFLVLIILMHNLQVNIVGKNQVELQILGQKFIYLVK